VVTPLALAIALLAPACAELTPPAAYSPTTSSTVVADPQGSGETVEETPTEAPEPIAEFVPTAAPGYVPSLLVAANRPVFAVDGLDSLPLAGNLAGLQALRVFDDLGGGVVVQRSDGSVDYLLSQGRTDLLLEPSDALLLDVGFWGASPRAFVRSAPGRVDWIQLVTEEQGRYERRTHFELAEAEEIVDFSASRDIQAVIVKGEGCGQIRFYNADGQQLALPEPPPPPCTFPGRPSFGSVALSPDGGAVAYTIVTYRDDGTEQVTELAARELLSGQAIFNRRIGENLDAISSLTYDGKRVAYVRSSGGDESVTLLDLTDGSSELAVDLLGATDIHSVAFTRIPLEEAP
jgi:hypothetical protein